MKVIELIHPPHLDSSDDRLDPPLGLLYIASHIKNTFKDGEVEVRINDLSGKQPDEWKIGKADFYGVTVYAPSMKTVESIIKLCKQVNPVAKIIVGGAHPSAVPQVFEGIVDHVVIGYGEQAVVDIVKGISLPFQVKSSKVFDLFARPSYELIDVASYSRLIGGKKSLPVLTARGCPFKCTFCGLSHLHNISGVKFSDPEVVVDQISWIIDTYGITSINFQDDVFTLKKERFHKLLDLIAPLNIKFRCHGRATIDTEETYELLAKAGCVQIAWGIESGSQYMLDKMNKRSKVEDNYNVIQWAKKYGIDSRAFFVIGFPGETRETLEETKKFISDADPDQYFISSFVPYPGTDVWNNPEKYGITNMSKDFSQFYQVDKTGHGGLTIDTQWLTREEFSVLEHEFREWMVKNKPLRGNLQNYEAKMKVE